MGRRDAEKERVWRERIIRQASSGLSVREFCRKEKLAESAFFSWRRELRLRDQEGNKRGLAVRKRLAGKKDRGEQGFVSLEVRSARPEGAAVEVILSDRITLRVMAGCDAETLRRVLAALESAPC